MPKANNLYRGRRKVYQNATTGPYIIYDKRRLYIPYKLRNREYINAMELRHYSGFAYTSMIPAWNRGKY